MATLKVKCCVKIFLRNFLKKMKSLRINFGKVKLTFAGVNRSKKSKNGDRMIVRRRLKEIISF